MSLVEWGQITAQENKVSDEITLIDFNQAIHEVPQLRFMPELFKPAIKKR